MRGATRRTKEWEWSCLSCHCVGWVVADTEELATLAAERSHFQVTTRPQHQGAVIDCRRWKPLVTLDREVMQ